MAETRTLRVVIAGNSKEAQKALNQLTNVSKRTESGFGSFAKGIGGKMAALGGAIAAADIGRRIYEIGSSYEQNMNVIAGLDPTANIKNVDAALQAQSGTMAKMGVNTQQGSEALKELIKAGQTTDQALKSLQGTLLLSTAGQMDAADSASLVANNLNAFGLGADKAGQVANTLANAANLSSADVSDLGMALSQSAAVANMAGLSFDQTTAYIAALSNVGIQGSDAGTSLKTMFMRLSGSVPEANKQIKNLGLSLSDAKGNMKPVATVMQELQGKLGGMSEAARNDALGKIFGSDSIRAASALLPKAGTQLDNLIKGVQRSGGAADAAAARTKGFSGALNEMKARSQSAMQGVYSAVSPTLERVARGFLDLTPKIGSSLAPLGGKLKSVFAEAGKSSGIAEGLGKAFGVITTFGKAMLPTLQAIGRDIMAVVGPAIKDISNLIGQKLLPAFNAFVPAITPVAQFLLKVLGGAVVGLIKGLVSTIMGLINIISGVFQILTAVMTGNWRLAWEGVKNILLGAVQFIWGRVQWVWNMGIISVFRKGFTFLLNIVKGGFTFVKSMFGSGTTAIGSVMSKVGSLISRPFVAAFNGVRSYVGSGWAYVRGAFSGGVGGVRAIIGRIIEVITWPHRQAFSLLRSLITGAWSAVRGLFTGGVSSIRSIMSGVKNAVTGVFSGAGSWLSGAAREIINGFVGGITNGIDRVKAAAAKLASALPGPVKKVLGIASPSKVFTQFGVWITDGLAIGLRKGTASVVSAMEQLATKVKLAHARGQISTNAKNSLLSLIQWEGKQLLTATNRRAKLATLLSNANKKLAAAQNSLNGLKAAKAALSGKIGETITSGSTLSANADGAEGTSINAILARMRAKLGAAGKFRDNLYALGRKGVYPSILQELAGMGPEQGGLIAAELLRGSSGQLAQLNALQHEVLKMQANAGDFVAGGVYNSQIKAAQAKVITEQRSVMKIQVEVANAAKADAELAKRIAAEVRNEMARIARRNGN